MTDLEDILKILTDQTGRSIQCGYDKGASPAFLPFDEAKLTPFVRFGNAYFLPSISIDVDTHKSHIKILSKCSSYGLPFPTLILDTDKGLHVHWVLSKPISLRNTKVKYFYQQIISSLVELFETDKNAVPKNSGRLFRNPLLHKTTIYNPSLVELSNFKSFAKQLTSLDNTSTTNSERVKTFSHYKKPDFTKIVEGGRNTTLFDYGRAYAYRNSKKDNLKESVIIKLSEANKLFPFPLPHSEVVEIASSIVHFVKTKYTGRTKNQNTIDFNRKLAKITLDETRTKMLQIFFAHPTLTIKDLRAMSFRAGGKLFGVHKNTFKTHLDGLIEDIKLSVKLSPYTKWETEPTFKETYTNITNYKPVAMEANTS